ncbi:MAG: type IV secretory system conjugative DNA transfer family protein [Oscillospiraceae bacterium]|jgi:type IV secretion system protein VirD4|nr:type IV secretory system conjugative DNA transfer family protein [Oscillospiraceae bacterium]
MTTAQIALLILSSAVFAAAGFITYFSGGRTLNIKSKTVGDGQHGTAHWASKREIHQTYAHLPFTPKLWRAGANLPNTQGIVVGCAGAKKRLFALADTGDVHALMIGAAGVGKTAYFMIPNLEFACASGMSFLCSDTKGDLYRQYAPVACEKYGYDVSVLDLRNPARSDGFNMLHLVNRYMDEHLATGSLAAKAKAERYAKITAKTIILSDGADAGNMGQNAFFYESAEGLLTSVILLIAEFAAPRTRHIVSAFKLIQDLLAPSPVKGKNLFQLLIERLPPEHKARWFAGAALNASEQGMAAVLSTAMSRLNAFLDSELEQVLCFDTKIDAESFTRRKSAIFIVLPEENPSTFFLVSLIVQQLYREMLSVADEHGGKLPNRVLLLLDEFGTIPKIQSAEMMFSASRSRRISIVAIIQSLAQLEKNYGREGAEVIWDNTQLTVFGGFAPNSATANTLSKNLGEKTVMSGSVSKGKGDGSQSLQMMARPLMTSDELKAMPRGRFIVAKTGCYPMRATLRLFTEWGITFDGEYALPDKPPKDVEYTGNAEISTAIAKRYPRAAPQFADASTEGEPPAPRSPRFKKPRADELKT